MNHKLWTSVGARVIALAFVIAGAAACHDKISDGAGGTAPAVSATSSARVIGTAPAEPQAEPSGTTAVAPNTRDLTKQSESTQMPKEGQDSSHLTEAPNDSQRSGANGDKQTQRRAQ
jgi:hypothetical protein